MIRPNFHNQDLVSKPLATNLETGQELLINVPKVNQQQQANSKSAQLVQSTEDCKTVNVSVVPKENAHLVKASVVAKEKAQHLQVVATSQKQGSSGKTIKVLKVVKAGEAQCNSQVAQNMQTQNNVLSSTNAQLPNRPKPDYSQSGLDILAEVASLNAEMKKKEAAGPNLVTNIVHREGQTGLVAMKSGFTSTEKERIDAKNLGTNDSLCVQCNILRNGCIVLLLK